MTNLESGPALPIFDELLPCVNATMPNGDPGKLVIPQVKIVAMFNLIWSEDVGLTGLKIVGKWISKIVNLKEQAWVMPASLLVQYCTKYSFDLTSIH